MKSITALVAALLLGVTASQAQAEVRIKELTRIQGVRDYSVIGYGLVVGLAGSGDSERNRATRQALVNTLKNFNVNVADSDLNARNTAAVMITGTLRSFAETGDKIDVEVSSLGDSRSLLGGTLLMTPLYGPDEKLYALAQGPVSVGGFAFEANANSVQKNHPTVGRIPRGASIERSAFSEQDGTPSNLVLVLNDPDYTTAQRIADTLTTQGRLSGVRVAHAARVEIPVLPGTTLPRLISRIENLSVNPDYAARVVVNERTGTVVAGANVRIGEVNISQGNLNVVISTKYQVSQPVALIRPGANVSSVVVPDTEIDVHEAQYPPVQLAEGAKVGDLVQALNRIKLSTREIITVLQAIKQAGALHAELIIQ
ncbi:flagellar biosynthesis protein FlgI [Pseudomonas sp. LLC-1]|uniref:flagellar basal body P-ring protein FlgI n=1 Tax=Pseudomonas sp. LLC-1 TaxID=1812180 RepID=UPI000D01BD2C|nr:flagellar basal body P-ring protein FlgI [Pseudomonas sp. LLC-1]PRN02997.1 flagellar biosynthesis protein FlgI [Pseudomonas sp. LLC-1]